MRRETREIAYLREFERRFRRLASRDTDISAELKEIAAELSAKAVELEELFQSKPLLTQRELEVLSWVAQGKTAKDISDLLKIAERTVEAHVDSTMRKLKARTRTQAVVIALRRGV